MKLRNVEKFKKEARLYKNISDKIDGKKLSELSPEISKALEFLERRKKLLEELNNGNLDEVAKEALYQSINLNTAYFENMEPKERKRIEEQFRNANDSYANTDQWQNWYMAFISTSNLSGYKAVDNFNATFEDLKNRKAKIDEAKKGLMERRKELQKKYPDFDPKTAKTEYEKYQKEIVKLNKEKEKLEQASEQKEIEVSGQRMAIKKQYRKDMADLELQKEKLYLEYSNTKKELEERKQKLGEVYKAKKILETLNPLTIEGKEIYTQTGAKLESAQYFENLNTKEYTELKNEYLQAKEEQEKAKSHVIENATEPLKRYLEEKPTEKENADLKVIRKAIGFFIVCRKPYDAQSEKYLSENPHLGRPIVAVQTSVGQYINSTLARKRKATNEASKKELVFAESFRTAMKEFAAVYLRDIPNPTEKQIDEVVNMLENLKPTEGQRLLRSHRKAIENSVNERKAALFSKLSEAEQKDYQTYIAPEKTEVLLGMLEESRKVFKAKVIDIKDKIFFKEKVSLPMEEAEIRLQPKLDKEIEKIIGEEIKVRNRKLYRQAGIKFETSDYFSHLNEKEYTKLKNEYLQIKETQEKAKDHVIKNAAGALKIYLDPGPTKEELTYIETIKKTIGFFTICKYHNIPEAKKFLAENPQLPKPTKIEWGMALKEYLDDILSPKKNETEDEKKMRFFAESFKTAIKEAASVFLRDVKNPTERQLEEVIDMLQADTPEVGVKKLQEQIKVIEKGVKDRKAAALLAFTPEDKAQYAAYTAPEKTDRILSMLEESRKEYDKMVNEEIEEANTTKKEKITKEEAIRRVQIKCDAYIDKMIEKEIRKRGGELSEEYNVKNFHISEADRTLRYDVWLKKELETIAIYEKNNSAKMDKDIQKEIDEVELATKENKQRWKKIGEINNNILTVRPEQYKKDMEQLNQEMAQFNQKNEEKIDEIDVEINKNLIPMKIAARFLFKDTKHKKQVENLKDIAEQNCKNAPRLDLKPVIKESHNTAVALLNQKAVYAKGHTNSKEFDNMMNALEVVVNWGEKNTALETMQNPPKSYEEALDRLKANRDVYREAKDRQRRPFPSKMRRMRLELTNAIDVFVDTEKVRLKEIAADEKAIDSWNTYFESGGKTSISKEQNKAFEKDTKQMEENVLENEDLDFGM